MSTGLKKLGLELEGAAAVGGAWADQLPGLEGVQVNMVIVRSPDGSGRVELSTFRSPPATAAPREPEDTPGIPRRTFVVDDVDDTLRRLCPPGAELVGEIAQYLELCRYCYIRDPANIIIGLVEELG